MKKVLPIVILAMASVAVAGDKDDGGFTGTGGSPKGGITKPQGHGSNGRVVSLGTEGGATGTKTMTIKPSKDIAGIDHNRFIKEDGAETNVRGAEGNKICGNGGGAVSLLGGDATGPRQLASNGGGEPEQAILN